MLSRNSAVDTPSPVGPGNQGGGGERLYFGLGKGKQQPDILHISRLCFP